MHMATRDPSQVQFHNIHKTIQSLSVQNTKLRVLKGLKDFVILQTATSTDI